jgi:hypothetical protein
MLVLGGVLVLAPYHHTMLNSIPHAIYKYVDGHIFRNRHLEFSNIFSP